MENRIFKVRGLLVWKIIILLLIVSCHTHLFAQQNARIEGRLVESKVKEPVMFASVALYQLPDTSMVKGNITDEEGAFAFNDVKYGNYLLEISCMGYENIKKGDISVNETNSDIKLGEIPMFETVNKIEEVVVEGERLKAVEEVDKTVYYVNEKVVQSSSSGLDMLKHIPAVQVDFRENISLAGKSNILVLIDGKTRDKEYLAQLDPARIDKIEVSTNPSVKYDASLEGVINVVLKKEKRHGLSGGFKAEIPGGLKIFNERFNLEYGYNKFRAYAQGRMHYESLYINKQNTYRRTVNNGIATVIDQKGDGDGTWKYANVSGGFDWFIDDQNTLSYYVDVKPGRGGKQFFDYEQNILVNDVTENINRFSIDKTDENTAWYHSLYYKKTFDKPGQELTADLNFYDFYGYRNTDYTEEYFEADGMTSLYGQVNRHEFTKNFKNKVGLKVDYVHPVNEQITLMGGFENYSQFLKNNYDNSNDASLNDLKYTDIRNAGYGNISGNYEKFSFQAGLRVEANNVLIDKESETNYFFLSPNMSLQYKLNKNQSFKVNYKRFFHRPGINDLNPFVYTNDSTSISHGDPYLKPAKISKYTLSFSAQVGKSYVSPELYLTTFNDGIDWITFINNDGLSENIPANVGKGGELGAQFSGSIKITDWWQLNPYVCVFYKKQIGVKEHDIPTKEKVSFRTSMSTMFSLPKDFVLASYVYYGSPYIITQKTFSRDAIYVINAGKKILKSGKIELSWILPFKNDFLIRKEVKESGDYYERNEMQLRVKYFVQAGFSYNFSLGSKIKKLRRNTNAENDGNGGMF